MGHSQYYFKSIKNIASMVNPEGYVCFILGNRISGGQEMRLDLFTDWAFKQNGFKKVGKTETFEEVGFRGDLTCDLCLDHESKWESSAFVLSALVFGMVLICIGEISSGVKGSSGNTFMYMMHIHSGHS